MSRRYLTLLLPFLLLGTVSAMPQQQAPEKAAQEAAESWLRLIDAGKYAESWDELAEVAKANVTKESWEKLRNDGATPNGADEGKARKLTHAQSTSSLRSVKDKAGVMLSYRSRLDSHRSVTEIVELVQEEGRGWRVAFYMRMANTLLFEPSSLTSGREELLVDPMPTGDPKGVPGL